MNLDRDERERLSYIRQPDGLLSGFTRDDLDEIIEELWSRHYIK